MPRPHWLSYSRRTDSGWTQPVRIFEAITDDNLFSPGVVVLPDGLVVAAIGDIALGIEGLWNGAFVTWGMGQTWASPCASRLTSRLNLAPSVWRWTTKAAFTSSTTTIVRRVFFTRSARAKKVRVHSQ